MTRQLVQAWWVDHSEAETQEILRTAPIRMADDGEDGQRPQIYVDGRWLDLCRTDLKDDVCTHFLPHPSTPEAARSYYLKLADGCYGARCRHAGGLGLLIKPDGSREDISIEPYENFAIIDSWSDG